MTKRQSPMTSQAPVVECQSEIICPDIRVHLWFNARPGSGVLGFQPGESTLSASTAISFIRSSSILNSGLSG
jgi:hypothetical protein